MIEEENTKEKVTTDEIGEEELDSTPRFYESLTDNPVANIFKGNKETGKSLIRLERVVDFDLVIPASPAPFVPAFGTAGFQHKVKRGVPIVFAHSKVPLADQSIFTTTMAEESVEVKGVTIGSGATVPIRAYVYSYLTKGR
jgi:hypothetical protein